MRWNEIVSFMPSPDILAEEGKTCSPDRIFPSSDSFSDKKSLQSINKLQRI